MTVLLGIDTATGVTSLGVCRYGEAGTSVTFLGPKKQLESVGSSVQELFSRSEIDRSAVSALALDVGPGLFSGLRVGVSFAKSFAGALGIPIVPVSSLDILAFSQRNTTKLIVSVVDARRGEVFYAMYRRVPGGGIARISSYVVDSPESLAVEIESMAEPTLLVGQGASRYDEAFSGIAQLRFAGSAVAYPLMPMLMEIAFPLYLSGQFVSPEAVEVIYIRDADAKVNFEVRHALGKGK